VLWVVKGKELSVGNISLVYPKIASFFLFPSQYSDRCGC
jgi:hypothetical protein